MIASRFYCFLTCSGPIPDGFKIESERFGDHFGIHFGTRSTQEEPAWAEEGDQKLELTEKLHLQTP